MNNTIYFSKIIQKLLDKEGIKKHVNSKIYPLIAPLSTTFPYIVYQRNDNQSFTKDNQYQSELTYNIIVVAEDYDTSLIIADAIISELDGKRNLNIDDYKIASIRLSGTSENYNDAYLQQLTFIFKVNK